MENYLRPTILLVFANNWVRFDRHLHSLKEERRRLEGLFRPLADKGLCDLVTLTEAMPEEVLDHFQSTRFRDRTAIFHFAGHANAYRLLLETAAGAEAPIDGSGLAAFLGQQQGLQLAFFNGCQTANHAEALLAAGVKIAIVSTEKIEGHIAAVFAERFYKALIAYRTVADAFQEAYSTMNVIFGDLREGGDFRTVLSEHGLTVRQTDQRGVGEATDDSPPPPPIDWPTSPPWQLHPNTSINDSRVWRLSDVFGDPLLALPPIPADIQLPPQPFRNLAHFEREHARIFFGRGHDIATLYQSLTDADGAPILLLFGQSGVGKSSLLAAGGLPRLEASYETCYLRTRHADALKTLISEIIPDDGSAEPYLDLLTAWQRHEQRSGKPLIVVLDQAEAFFRITTVPTQTEVFDGLVRVFGTPSLGVRGRLVLGFREEYLALIEDTLQRYGLPYACQYLAPLNHQHVREAVEGIVRNEQTQKRYRLSIEDPDDQPLVDYLWADLHADPNTPLAPTLQILLTKLWTHALQQNRATPTFTLAAYQTLKRDGIYLADFLDQQLTALGRDYHEAETSGLLIDLLYHHTTPSGSSAEHTVTSLQRYYPHSQDDIRTLLNAAQDRQLLTFISTDSVNGETPQLVSRLSHDSLGPLIQQRFEQSDKPGQRARRILVARIQETQHNPNTLLPADDLATVERGALGMRTLSDPEVTLVKKSRIQCDRSRWWRRIGIAAGMAAVVLIVVFAIQSQQAAERAQRAQARFLAQAARDMAADGNPQLSTLLALEAVSLSNALTTAVPEAETALYYAASLYDVIATLDERQAALTQARFHPQDTHVVTAGSDGDVILLNLSNQQRDRQSISGETITDVDFSPDGRVVALVTEQGSGYFWHINTGELDQFANLPTVVFSELAFSPDGRRLAISAWDDVARIWNLEEQRWATILKGHHADVASVDFSPDGTTLVTGSKDGTAILWDSNTGELLRRFEGHQATVQAARFNPQGGWFATASADATIKFWQVDSGTPVRTLAGTQGKFTNLSFSPDGSMIVTGSATGWVLIWHVETGELLLDIPAAQRGLPIHNAIFDSQGTTLLTAADDGRARTWAIQPLAVDELINVASRELQGRTLTASERKRFFLPSMENP